MPMEQYSNTSEFSTYFKKLEEKGEINETLLMRSYLGLVRNGIVTNDQLRDLTKKDALKIRQIGKSCWSIIETAQSMLPKKVKVRKI